MKVYCVVDHNSKKVYRMYHHKASAVTWASLHSRPGCDLVVVQINLDEYMKQVM